MIMRLENYTSVRNQDQCEESVGNNLMVHACVENCRERTSAKYTLNSFVTKAPGLNYFRNTRILFQQDE